VLTFRASLNSLNIGGPLFGLLKTAVFEDLHIRYHIGKVTCQVQLTQDTVGVHQILTQELQGRLLRFLRIFFNCSEHEMYAWKRKKKERKKQTSRSETLQFASIVHQSLKQDVECFVTQIAC